MNLVAHAYSQSVGRADTSGILPQHHHEQGVLAFSPFFSPAIGHTRLDGIINVLQSADSLTIDGKVLSYHEVYRAIPQTFCIPRSPIATSVFYFLASR